MPYFKVQNTKKMSKFKLSKHAIQLCGEERDRPVSACTMVHSAFLLHIQILFKKKPKKILLGSF
jgi:hypothetical protein